MNIKYYIVIPILVLILCYGCENFLDPDKDNFLSEEQVLKNPALAEGILLNAYNGLPSSISFNEVATDDAVSNLKGNNLTRVALGEWKAVFNPLGEWSSAYENIGYINMFLKYVDIVQWSWENEWQNVEFAKRLKGEAYGLRAFFEYQLLVSHSGKTINGEYMGFPIITHLTNYRENWKEIKRDTYKACVEQIISDLDSAITFLPEIYADKSVNDPNKFNHDRVYGQRYSNRITGQAALLLKARVLLHAASPAFKGANVSTYAEAANAAAKLINSEIVGGLSKLENSRIEYYLEPTNIDILWRRDLKKDNRSLENTHFPPSLYGKGSLNPSQNLINAFPMRNGYYIDNPLGYYNPNKPYVLRDPRLEKYIIYHGAKYKGNVINTIDDPKDGLNKIETSTRTGYYLKKHLNENVNLTPGSIAGQTHFYTLMRFTEAFLIYAEAANQAWGPDGDDGNGLTARSVMAKLRQTSGIVPDSYLPTVNTVEEMDQLIRNERRIELCFEGFRFWDIRRWDDKEVMNQTVIGTTDGGVNFVEVESRKFADYMIYGPIPESEVKKGLEQNIGW